ncbi:MAG: hypothetical protein VB099_11645 [Candidatus Limiplasma sp.]|nr:hypothetical protein [Candidatus Limiplasma sp.]
MKKRISLWLALAWGLLALWGAAGTALAQEEGSEFLIEESAMDQQEVQAYISLGEDQVPTMFAAVGRRSIQSYAGWLDEDESGLNQRLAYGQDGSYQDVVDYGNYLLGLGWEELAAPTQASSGLAVYTLPALDGENVLTVTVDYGPEGYAVTATKRWEAAYAQGGWKPRTSALPVPQGVGEPRPLEGEGIPASYRQAGWLDMKDGRMAYPSFAEDSVLLVADIGQDWREAPQEWSVHERTMGFLLRQEDAVCLLAAGYEGEPAALEILSPEGASQMVQPPAQEQEEIEWDAYGGPLLEIGDGRLLFADAQGKLYACQGDGSQLAQVPGVLTHEFVYHEGFVYFANLQDQMTHENVYDQGANLYRTLSFPRLYRVKLDGSELTRLTDCGVRGLASQGPYILYQNLQEPYALPMEEMAAVELLFGPLYCYDAATGEHRDLGIESDDYLPTPWGLAVWYHDFSLEPYEIQRAELVLHSYEGTPLYALDAGPSEYAGDPCLYGGALCFYGYNWAYDWEGEEEQEEFLFAVTPLDGGPKGGMELLSETPEPRAKGDAASQDGQGAIIPALVSAEPPALSADQLQQAPVPGEYALGASIAVGGERIAFVGQYDEEPTLRVLRKQGDAYVLEALYSAADEISNVVITGDAVAYLTGPTQWLDEEAVYTLEVASGGEKRYSMSLGRCERPRLPYAGPLLALGDGRLLLADNLGTLYVLQPDGSGLRKVSEGKAGAFVYHQGQVYFENLEDQREYPQVYCRELGENLPMAYPQLYAVSLEGSQPRRITQGGVRGLVSQGGMILYQDMEEPFVLPYGELPEEWLCGSLTRYGGEEAPVKLGMLSGRYTATQAGLAVWYDLWGPEGHREATGRLALHDWEGRPLRFLDASPELAYAPCAAAGDSLWFVKPYDPSGAGADVLVRVPLDGGEAQEIIPQR